MPSIKPPYKWRHKEVLLATGEEGVRVYDLKSTSVKIGFPVPVIKLQV